MLDPILEDTAGPRRSPQRAARPPRRRSRLERWLLTELPAYRLGLLLGYGYAVYIGISALNAGVPVFDATAPPGYAPVWAWCVTVAGPIGLLGLVHDIPSFRAIELLGASIAAGALTVYATAVLFLAYEVGDEQRVTAGAALAAVATAHLVRMGWLIVQVALDAKARQAANQKAV